MPKYLIITALGAVLACPLAANADPWKDESGHGRWEKGYSRDDDDWRRRYYDPKDDDDWRRESHRRDDDDGWHRRYGGDDDWRRKGRASYGHGRCQIESRWNGDEYLQLKRCKLGRDREYRHTYDND
jgi:hypothetical protein